MPDALSLLSLVSNAASSLVSLVTSVVSSISNTISAVLNAGKTIAGALVQIGSSIGSAIGGILTAGIALGRGILSVAGSVASVGMAIGRTVVSGISGVVSTLSSVGGVVGSVVSAISGVFSSIGGVVGGIVSSVSGVVGSVVSVFSDAFSALTPVVGAVADAVGSAFSVITGVAGALFGAISGAVSGIVGAVTSVVGAVTSVVGALTSAFQSVSASLGAVAGVAGQALGGFASAVQSSVEALTTFAHDVAGITAQTGMNLSQASALTNDFRSIGISSGETAKIFGSVEMRPQLFNARSDATGLARMTDPNFEVNEAIKYQAMVGKIGLPAARSRLDAQFGGQAPDSVLRMVNMNPQTLQENINYGRDVNSKLGVGSGEIKAASEDIPLLINRISMFVDAVKMRFAADLLPSLEAAFGVVSNILENNAGKISSILQTATHAIFVDGPDLAANAALTALNWGAALINVFFSVADAAISLVEAFGNQDGALYGILDAGAGFIDFLIGMSTRISAGIAFIQAAFESSVHNFITTTVNAILGPFAAIPGVSEKAKDMLDQLTGFKFDAPDPMKAYNDTIANGTKFSARAELQKGAAFVHDNFDAKAARADIKQRRTDAMGLVDAGKQGVNDVRAAFGPTSGLEQTFQQQLLANQQKQLSVAQQHLNVAKDAQSDSNSPTQTLDRIGAYIAQDAYRLTNR